MIQEVSFKNFKALRDVTVPLAPFTVIVGPNASGKTSILEGLDYLSQLGSSPPEDVFGSDGARADALRTGGTTAEMTLSLQGVWNGVNGELVLSCGAPARKFGRWDYTLGGRWGGETLAFGADFYRSVRLGIEGVIKQNAETTALLHAVHSAVLLHLDPRNLAAPSFSEDMVPCVGSDGSELSAVLADMAIAAPDDYQCLQERLRCVVPSLCSLRLSKTTIEDEQFEEAKGKEPELYRIVKRKALGYQILFDFTGGHGLPAAQVSEGTLVTLGLLTVMTSPGHPNLVLIDELERGLHPKALGELVRQIREVQKQFPELQIVGTTHSPYLVDHFQPDEIVLTTLRDDGSVAVGRLNEHPEFERWKDEMKPGEFWSTVGEDWVGKGKVAPADGS